jgi:hypothetical protein
VRLEDLIIFDQRSKSLAQCRLTGSGTNVLCFKSLEVLRQFPIFQSKQNVLWRMAEGITAQCSSLQLSSRDPESCCFTCNGTYSSYNAYLYLVLGGGTKMYLKGSTFTTWTAFHCKRGKSRQSMDCQISYLKPASLQTGYHAITE